MMNKELPIYLDYAATTPVDKRVIKAMLPYFDEIFGNASSNHIYGKQAKQAIEKARIQVSELINAEPEEIIFTSGATEAINLGIKGFWEANRDKGNHIVTVKTEHKAVLETCKYLETIGAEVTYLGVDSNGLIDLEELRKAIQEDTILISVMFVNNETGVIQDIKAISNIAKASGIRFFCDATQAVGKIPVDVIEHGMDMLCMSAHKFNGPKGIGALYLSDGIEITPQIHGGGQENGLRSGTYNTPLIVGFGEAVNIVNEFSHQSKLYSLQKNKWQSYFEDHHLGTIKFKHIHRSPFIFCVNINENADNFLLKNKNHFAASSGSACNSELVQVSHVSEALNHNKGDLIRISFNAKR